MASFGPVTNAWTDLAPMAQARAGHTAVLLPDGLLVIPGGGNASGAAMHF